MARSLGFAAPAPRVWLAPGCLRPHRTPFHVHPSRTFFPVPGTQGLRTYFLPPSNLATAAGHTPSPPPLLGTSLCPRAARAASLPPSRLLPRHSPHPTVLSSKRVEIPSHPNKTNLAPPRRPAPLGPVQCLPLSVWSPLLSGLGPLPPIFACSSRVFLGDTCPPPFHVPFPEPSTILPEALSAPSLEPWEFSPPHPSLPLVPAPHLGLESRLLTVSLFPAPCSPVSTKQSERTLFLNVGKMSSFKQ